MTAVKESISLLKYCVRSKTVFSENEETIKTNNSFLGK